MTNQQPLMDSLTSLLGNNTSLTALVSTRIYDTMAPQDPTLPFVLLTVVSDPPQHYFNTDSVLMEVQTDVYGKIESGNAVTRTVADLVHATLNRASMTATGYTGLSILCTDRGHQEQDMIVGGRTQQDAWRQIQSFKVFATGS